MNWPTSASGTGPTPSASEATGFTKSRRYSTTFGALRDARTAWTRRELPAARQAPDSAVVKDWHYLGRGWANPGDSWLADTAAADLAESRRHARDARRAESAIPA